MLFTLSFALHFSLQGQLRGRILDPLSKAVAYCTVYNATQEIGTISNENGVFSIPASKNDTIFIRHLGYLPTTLISDDIRANEVTEIYLESLNIELDEVIVSELSGELKSRFDSLFSNFETDKELKNNKVRRLLYSSTKASKPYGISLDRLYLRLSGDLRELKTVVQMQEEDKWVQKLLSWVQPDFFQRELEVQSKEVYRFLLSFVFHEDCLPCLNPINIEQELLKYKLLNEWDPE